MIMMTDPTPTRRHPVEGAAALLAGETLTVGPLTLARVADGRLRLTRGGVVRLVTLDELQAALGAGSSRDHA